MAHDPRVPGDEQLATIADEMQLHNVPGIALAFFRDGGLYWQRVFGLRQVAPPLPVTENTVFHVASLGKPLFAYAVLRLCEAGRMDLDRPLASYMPNPYIPDEPRLDAVTARLVLSHRSGFPNWREHGKPLALVSTPGNDLTYSGEAFLYLQRVVETVTGKRIQAFMNEEVFEPLGMVNTSYVWREAYRNLAACGYWIDGRVGQNDRPAEASVGVSLFSTCADYGKFISTMLAGEALRSHCLSSRSLTTMLTPHTKIDDRLAWGLGWALQNTAGDQEFWCCGGTAGFSSFVVASPGSRWGILAMSNSAMGIAVFKQTIPQLIGSDQPGLISCFIPRVE